jgi:hypothetical protein
MAKGKFGYRGRREFIRSRRIWLRVMRKDLDNLRFGCLGLKEPRWGEEIREIERALCRIDEKTKPFA